MVQMGRQAYGLLCLSISQRQKALVIWFARARFDEFMMAGRKVHMKHFSTRSDVYASTGLKKSPGELLA